MRRTHGPRLDDLGGQGDDRDEDDAGGVVVVLVAEPQRHAEQLEHVERVEELQPTGNAHRREVSSATWRAGHELGVARFIDASIYRDTFPAKRIAILFLTIAILFF